MTHKCKKLKSHFKAGIWIVFWFLMIVQIVAAKAQAGFLPFPVVFLFPVYEPILLPVQNVWKKPF